MQKVKIVITKEVAADHYLAESLWGDDCSVPNGLTDEEATRRVKEAYRIGYLDCVDLIEEATWNVKVSGTGEQDGYLRISLDDLFSDFLYSDLDISRSGHHQVIKVGDREAYLDEMAAKFRDRVSKHLVTDGEGY